MEWTRSDTLALALDSCIHCRGMGLRRVSFDKAYACGCVFRGVFRVCYERFRYCASNNKHIGRATVDTARGPRNRWAWGRKEEEYVADFYLVTRRHLTDEDFRLFKYHFLLGAGWKLCCRKFGVDRSRFFQRIYALEQRLGRIYRELTPYALFPVDEYFNGTRRMVAPTPLLAAPPRPVVTDPPALDRVV